MKLVEQAGLAMLKDVQRVAPGLLPETFIFYIHQSQPIVDQKTSIIRPMLCESYFCSRFGLDGLLGSCATLFTRWLAIVSISALRREGG